MWKMLFIPHHEKMCKFTTVYTGIIIIITIICCGHFTVHTQAHMGVLVLLSKRVIISCFNHRIKIVVDF